MSRTRICVVLAAGFALIGCFGGQGGSSAEGPVSPSAKLDTVAMLLDDLAADRHSSDGGGRAWLEEPEPAVSAGRSATYRVTYEAGPEGIAEGGAVYLLPSPFWGWSGAQAHDPEMPGFTEVETSSEGVELEAFSPDGQILVVTIAGRDLREGERISMTYGAGPLAATVDRYAEQATSLWVAVDGDGDGIRAVLHDSPVVSVGAGPPSRLVMTLPSTARPGQPVRLNLAVLDAAGNMGVDFSGSISFEASAADAVIPAAVELDAESGGVGRVECTFTKHGTYRIVGRTDGGIEGESNPVVVSEGGTPIYWADLHGHSAYSDGSASPEQYLRYARDVAALDIVALTDHDHWGVLFLDQAPALWRDIRAQTEAFNDPGAFLTLLGFEWTNWAHGHRHVLYFDGDGEVLSSIDPRFDTPPELWQALAGAKALTVAHHSAGGPVATNWAFPPDPELEPVTEVVSVHGSSEAADSPHPIYSPLDGNWVRDVLDRGVVFGFVGSGDSHDGHSGLAHLASGTGGVAAIMANELNRDGVLNALKSRRVYATNGPRIVLRFAVDGHPLGSVIGVPEATVQAFVFIHGTAPVEAVDLIRSGSVVASSPGAGKLDLQFTIDIEDLRAGEYLYVRVTQVDGGAAWSSPVFVR